jgi:hypothetical protein
MNAPLPPRSTPVSRWRRLWQPRLPAFWLVVVFNLVSTTLVLLDKALSLPAGVRVWVLLLALVNSVLGIWWLGRLWKQTGEPVCSDLN